MEIPKGFDDIVKLVMKNKFTRINGPEIWNKFVQSALIGGGRSESDISFIINILRKSGLLYIKNISKIPGEKWNQEVETILKNRLDKIRDDDNELIINSFLKELFRITASLKGSARFFERKKVIENIDKLTENDEKTWEFIEELSEDEDVTNIRYTKVIIWLHSIGRAENFVPPTRQIKSFINTEIGPYYQYYEDDKYFMKKALELTDLIKSKIKESTAMDVTRAIFCYISIKSMVPRGYGKYFTCTKFMELIKKNKITIKKLSEMLSTDQKQKLMEIAYKSVR